MNRLFERGITVRNQSVLQRGVNDTAETMTLLVKRLGHVNVHPYYVYMHDLVKGVEDLRTTLQTGARSSRSTCAASTAGFNTPTFVVDAPGGGGKRDAHSLRALRPRDRHLASTRARRCKPGALLLLLRPASTCSRPRCRRAGPIPTEQEAMMDEALAQAKKQVRASMPPPPFAR